MKFLIVAGDPSGSNHAARLMHELHVLSPVIRFYGIGGDDMISSGLDARAHVRDVGVVGFWEVARRYPYFRELLSSFADSLQTEKPDAFIAVDYPGFNMRLAAVAKKAGVPVLYYIAPQLWAWGKNRAKRLAGAADLLLTVFPFETDFFSKLGIPTTFVGHPLLDDDTLRDTYNSGWDKRLIALLPGSRTQEVERNLPVLLAAARTFAEKHPSFTFAIPPTPVVPLNVYEDILSDYKPNGELSIEFADDSRLLMQSARAGLIKTGTSTLEAALCGLPFAMMYRASTFSYWYGKMVVQTPYLAMPNILAGREIVAEFVQHDATPTALAAELERLVFNEAVRAAQREKFTEIRRQLGGGGATRRAAEVIVRHITGAIPDAENA